MGSVFLGQLSHCLAMKRLSYHSLWISSIKLGPRCTKCVTRRISAQMCLCVCVEAIVSSPYLWNVTYVFDVSKYQNLKCMNYIFSWGHFNTHINLLESPQKSHSKHANHNDGVNDKKKTNICSACHCFPTMKTFLFVFCWVCGFLLQPYPNKTEEMIFFPLCVFLIKALNHFFG